MVPTDNFFIGITGNIGVGKSTFTQLLADSFEWHAFLEEYVNNPYLTDFYEDMRRWSFHSQTYFLIHRFRAHRRITETAGICIQDRTIYEDAKIFARIIYERGDFDERDYQTYESLSTALIEALKPPDLLVYLTASVWTLRQRIAKRGREFERSLDPEYLLTLNMAYERWVDSITRSIPTLVIPTDELDFENSHEDKKHGMELVRKEVLRLREGLDKEQTQ